MSDEGIGRGKHSTGDRALVNQMAVNIPFSVYVSSNFDTRYKADIIHGRNNNLTTNYTDLRVNGDLSVFLSKGNPQPMEIVSTSTDDDIGGTGATKVLLFMVDTNGEEYELEVDMDGTTAVPIEGTDDDGNAITDWIFCNRIIVKNTGSYGTNKGDITVQTTAGATPASTEIRFLEADEGIDDDLVYFIPEKYSHVLVSSIHFSTTKNEQVDSILSYKFNGNAWLRVDLGSVFQSHRDITRTVMTNIPSGSYIRMRGKAATSGGEMIGSTGLIFVY